MKRIISAACFLGLAAAGTSEIETEFNTYCKQHGKNYSSPDEHFRHMQFYMKKKAEIEAFNANPAVSAMFKKGLNAFSDLTPEEYSRSFGLSKSMLFSRRNTDKVPAPLPDSSELLVPEGMPDSWDWSKKGACTKARNQGNCGSCWSFAGTEAIESALFIKTGTLAELSPQAFLDCVPDPKHCGGTGGCEGATYDLLYSYANSTHGPVLNSDYTYTGKDGLCHINDIKPYAKVGGWHDVPTNNYTALMQAVMQTPVAVGVAAMNWGDYMGGVYPSELCDADIDHAVLLVGWGNDPGLGPYWKIKNSWGSDWGENGYIRLQRNPKFCTVDKVPGDGLGCTGGPKQVTVCGACAIQAAPSYPTDVTLA